MPTGFVYCTTFRALPKLFVCLLLTVIYTEFSDAQVVNRYPNIQRPSQTTATIAWRRATPAIATVYLGTVSGVWTDSLSSTTALQKHHVDLAGLQVDTRYYYQVRTVALADTFISAIESFYTSPLPLEDELSFLAYGDCGYNNSMQHQVKALMETETVDFAIVTGDIDQGVGDDYDNIFFGVYKNMLKQDCHFTCIGNHDTYADNAATYLDAFYLFSNNAANTERYYSFEWGDAKIVCLDANLDYTSGSPQFDWMVDEFRCNDKKWLCIFFHQPPWTNAWSLDYYVPFSPYFLYQGDEDMRSDLVPEFEKYGVDFVVNGHSHCYQRGSLNGVQYLVTGGAGANSLDGNTNSNAPNLSVEIYENHYVRFDIKGDTAKYVMINANGQRRDSVMVVKPYIHYTQNILGNDLSCHAANDGSASVLVNGPKPPYRYAWNTGATSYSISGLAAGWYTVTISDSVDCARYDSVYIDQPSLQNSLFGSSTGNLALCDSIAITLTALGNSASYNWSTGDTSQSILVSTPGTYTLTSYDTNACPSLPYTVNIPWQNTPSGNLFSYTTNGLVVSFSANFTGNHWWEFGDSTAAFLSNPTHSYPAAGWYQVLYIIGNACGNDTLSQLIQVGNTSINQVNSAIPKVNVQPNPFDKYCWLEIEHLPQEGFDLSICDVHGKVLRQYLNINSSRLKITKEDLNAGVYFCLIKSRNLYYTTKLIVR